MLKRLFFLPLLAALSSHAQRVALKVATDVPSGQQNKGLAQHDFLYTGESPDCKIFLIRQGKIVWSYEDPEGKGEISDTVMLSNGNILFAHQFGVTEITQDKKKIWNYDTPPGYEVHTALPIGTDRVLFIQNGDPAVLRVVNIKTNAIEKEIKLATHQPSSTHGQFRHARLTEQGTIMVAHMDLNKVVEYDFDGKELWSFPAINPWGVTPLSNKNVLITDRNGVREVTRRGDTVWNFSPTDLPGYKFANLQQAWRLPNGDTVINNWINKWNKEPGNEPGHFQAIQLTHDKKVAWVLQSWTPPSDLGPATTLQFLDTQKATEDVYFGPIR